MRVPKTLNIKALFSILAVVLTTCIVMVPTTAKWAAYEVAGAGTIRSAIGRNVELRHDGKRWQGTLTQASYRLNDKWGFFDLAVEIEGRGSIWTGLEPAELSGLIVKD